MTKKVRWTPELVSSFWNTLAEVSLLTRFSFAKAAAPMLVPLVEPFLRQGADYIDYGGGDGHLCQYLVERGFRCGVYEPSKIGVQNLTERLGNNENFLGAFSTIDNERFDGVFCLEVIEHVLDEGLETFLSELVRIIKRSGFVVVTCPNLEDLDNNSVVCPVCESYFHRWQHVRSLQVTDVTSLLATVDLRTEWVGLIGFEAAEAIQHWCTCRDENKRFSDRKLTRIERLRARFINIEKKIPDDGINLRIGSESNIVLIARKSN